MTRTVLARVAPVLALVAAVLVAGACSSKITKLHPCPAGQSYCGGLCQDLQVDRNSCGACFHRCPAEASCQAGGCVCPDGKVECNGQCVDVDTSAEHCGGCNQPCGLGTCSGGACSCQAAATQCPGFPSCVDLQTDTAHCGSCSNACTRPGDSCVSGGCTCVAPRTDCTTACADLQADAANCGTCGNVCPHTNDVCKSGACACPTGKDTVCSNTCVDLASNEANCGACGKTCPSGASCTSGACVCGSDRVLCGANPGTCCQGDSCCPSGDCETKHPNGVGDYFFDCAALGTYNYQEALSAADAWNTNATGLDYDGYDRVPGCGQGCFCRDTAQGSATWCYGGSKAGRVWLGSANETCNTQTCTSSGVTWK